MLVTVNLTSNPARQQKLREQIESHLGAEIDKIELSLDPVKFDEMMAEAEVIAAYRFSAGQFSLPPIALAAFRRRGHGKMSFRRNLFFNPSLSLPQKKCLS